jgi:hypothetical protein
MRSGLRAAAIGDDEGGTAGTVLLGNLFWNCGVTGQGCVLRSG